MMVVPALTPRLVHPVADRFVVTEIAGLESEDSRLDPCGSFGVEPVQPTAERARGLPGDVLADRQLHRGLIIVSQMIILRFAAAAMVTSPAVGLRHADLCWESFASVRDDVGGRRVPVGVSVGRVNLV